MAQQQRRGRHLMWSEQYIQSESYMPDQDPRQICGHTQPSGEPSAEMTGLYIGEEPEIVANNAGRFPLQPSTDLWRSGEAPFEDGYTGYNTNVQTSASTPWRGNQYQGYGQNWTGSETNCHPNALPHSGHDSTPLRFDINDLAGLCDNSSFNPDSSTSDGRTLGITVGDEGYPLLATVDLVTQQDTAFNNSTMWNPISSDQFDLNTGVHFGRQEQQMMAGMNFNDAEPWSYPRSPNMDPMSHEHLDGEQFGVSETSCSAVGFSDPASDFWTRPDCATSTSSVSCSRNAMGDSSVTVQPPVWTPGGNPNCNVSSTANGLYDPPINPPWVNLERSATPGHIPQMNSRSLNLDPRRLAPRMERNRSSISSSGTDESSVDLPLGETLPCDQTGCRSTFTGEYRRGNLARHKRLCHGHSSPYVCQDETCAKGFKRQDARLKHYRKRHPGLAANSPYRPRPRGTGTPK